MPKHISVQDDIDILLPAILKTIDLSRSQGGTPPPDGEKLLQGLQLIFDLRVTKPLGREQAAALFTALVTDWPNFFDRYFAEALRDERTDLCEQLVTSGAVDANTTFADLPRLSRELVTGDAVARRHMTPVQYVLWATLRERADAQGHVTCDGRALAGEFREGLSPATAYRTVSNLMDGGWLQRVTAAGRSPRNRFTAQLQRVVLPHEWIKHSEAE